MICRPRDTATFDRLSATVAMTAAPNCGYAYDSSTSPNRFG